MNCTTARLPSLEFTSETFFIVSIYLVVFVIALLGNMSIFMILLSYIPKEVIHNITGMWLGGDTVSERLKKTHQKILQLCRLCKFFDVFGVSLSANILMCLSLDRFYSILFPLYSINAKKHVLRMIAIAWTTAFLSSLPQVYIFRTAVHPCFPWYTQCVSSDLIGLISPKVTFWFSVLNILEVYILPLLVIVVCYSSILISISIKSGSFKGSKFLKTKSDGTQGGQNQALLRRAGGQDNFERAKSRTLQMTFFVMLDTIHNCDVYTFSSRFKSSPTDFSTSIEVTLRICRLQFGCKVCSFNNAKHISYLSPYLCVYSYFSFQQIYSELQSLLCCQPATSLSNARSSSLAERKRAIRRPADSLTNNSLSAFSPNNTTVSLNFSRRISVAKSRTARVRLGASPQAFSFDEASASRSNSRRPSQLQIMSTITDVPQSPLDPDSRSCTSRKVSYVGTAHSSPTVSVHREILSNNDAL
ncbi:CBR-GNRR-1 protein [Aphelenchoides besseyi]|nr:CBR-GNRR-1 protein [Aphelenchoides besseyi]